MKALFLISSVICIIFFGCGKRPLLEESHYISNFTNKTIIHELELSDRLLGYKLFSIIVNKICKDSLEWTFVTKSKSISYKFDFYVYNITDTTSITLPLYSLEYSRPWGSLSKFYYSKYDVEYGKQVTRNYLIINDSFLTLFQKDTSMLTQFKDYYNK